MQPRVSIPQPSSTVENDQPRPKRTLSQTARRKRVKPPPKTIWDNDLIVSDTEDDEPIVEDPMLFHEGIGTSANFFEDEAVEEAEKPKKVRPPAWKRLLDSDSDDSDVFIEKENDLPIGVTSINLFESESDDDFVQVRPRRKRKGNHTLPLENRPDSNDLESGLGAKNRFVGGYLHRGDDPDANFIQPEDDAMDLPDDVAKETGFVPASTISGLTEQLRSQQAKFDAQLASIQAQLDVVDGQFHREKKRFQTKQLSREEYIICLTRAQSEVG